MPEGQRLTGRSKLAHPYPTSMLEISHSLAKSARRVSHPRFGRELLAWFDGNKRDLPWRKDHDPYRVWLSEIMLQQTRVAAVIEHYKKFLERFPTLQALAAAREAAVLAAWSGLGYYRRARMLHAAAREIVRQRAGEFPASAGELRTLPGIGRYTAAAIASIAFGEAAVAVDGNVERVLQRVVGKELRGEELWRIAEGLLCRKKPGDFNQAMMELGATVCTPREPKCLLCPVATMCRTCGELPRVKEKSRQKKREICYGLDCRNGSVFLLKRAKDAALMPGMWELPEIPAGNGSGETWLKLRHSITVTDYLVHVIPGKVPAGTGGRWIAKSCVAGLPLTGLARKILRAAQVI